MSVVGRSPRKTGNSAYHDVNAVYSHIIDPNERRRMALAEIDKAPLSWYHLRLVVVTGVGFFTDAYSLFVIGIVTYMLGVVYSQTNNDGVLPAKADTIILSTTTAGTIFGQIVFGYLADLLGRQRMYGVELLIIITTTLAQSLASSSVALNVFNLLSFWRFLMGVGVGGDYPLSAVITSEMADTKWRGAMIGTVFAMQGFGQFFAAIMSLIVSAGFKDTLQQVSKPGDCTGQCQKDFDIMWRIVLGFGGIPGWFALYYRLTIPETPRYTFDVKHDLEKAAADSRRFRSGKRGGGKTDELERARVKLYMRKYKRPLPSIGEFCRYFCNRKHFLVLLGTAGSWFFVDVAFYGVNLNNSIILSIIGFSKTTTVYEYIKSTAVGQLVLVCAGQVPGYLFTIALVDNIGRKPIQIGGFAILTLIFAVIGFCFHHLSQGSLLALYILAQFFFNFGPNAITFIISSECFPTHIRATAYGISAAAGKVGALIGQDAINPLASRGGTAANPHPRINSLMKIYALFMLCGVITSFLIPETKRKTLEELAGETERNPAYELRFFGGLFRQGTPDRRRRAQREED